MAEDLRTADSQDSVMEPQALEIIRECERQAESCQYTSTAMYEWLKEVRVFRVAFITLPIIFGSIAGTRVLLKDPSYEWLTALCALLAGLFPAIFKALDLDVSLKTMSDSAHRFKVLQDRFRQASRIGATKPIDELQEDFQQLMERMDDARAASLAIPNRHFRKAQKIISKGAYDFAVDQHQSRAS